MYNAGRVIPGLVVFLAVCTMPFWGNIGSAPYTRPAVELPPRELPEGETACIEPMAFMRAEHMRLLNDWRDAALRDGKRTYTASDGKMWEASLQNTCMRCHASQERFCGVCHDANSVTPYCWTCHIKPEDAGQRAGLPPDMKNRLRREAEQATQEGTP